MRLLYLSAAGEIPIPEGDSVVIPATQIKVGNIILHDGKPCRVTSVLHVTPGNWRGMVHAKMVNLVTGSQVEYRFRSEDKVERADLDHHPLQYLYRSQDREDEHGAGHQGAAAHGNWRPREDRHPGRNFRRAGVAWRHP